MYFILLYTNEINLEAFVYVQMFFFGKDENVWLWGYLLREHYLNMCIPIGKTCLNFRVHQR